MKKTLIILIGALIVMLFAACPNPLGGGDDDGGGGVSAYELTVETSVGGTIVTPSSSPTTVDPGAAADIEAEADTGYHFLNWTTADSGVSFDDANAIATTVTLTDGDATITANFAVDTADAVFVDINFSGTHDGTAAYPFQHIEQGITEAQNQGYSNVYVAVGSYNFSDSITMIEGISVYGGFNNDNGTWTRHPYQTEANRSTYLTEIKFNGEDLPAVEAKASDITNATVMEGFTIIGWLGTYCYGILCESGASPTIQYNTITGGSSGSNSDYAHGIRITSSSPLVRYNVINSGTASTYAYGIYIEYSGSDPTIAYNTINGDNGTDWSHGIYASGANYNVHNNTITGGTGYNSDGIYNSNSTGTIAFNTIDGGSGSNNSTAFYAAQGTYTIENNTIFGGVSPYKYSNGIVTTNGSNTEILNNDIDGGEATYTYAIRIIDSDSNIESNDIFGGGGSMAFGINSEDSTVAIQNNTIDGGGDGTYKSVAINDSSLSSTIQNNTIDAGSNNLYTYGINIYQATPVIQNNIIFSTSTNSGRGINEDDETADAQVLENNSIFGCSNSLYYDYDAFTGITDIADVNTLSDVTGGCSGNITASPAFTDQAGGDWHLTASSPLSVSEGGLDLSAEADFPEDSGGNKIDKDAVVRTGDGTDGWSIGAYEYD